MLPRKRKDAARFEPGSGVGAHPNTPKDLLCQDYFEYLDTIVACVRNRLKNLEETMCLEVYTGLICLESFAFCLFQVDSVYTMCA